ncbi:hypothetical protein CRG98_020539 [Punica granatum]|uniref:Uncharacterized protein n=2 Tax=Punica granatum TaxID=22663 RepID=A0A2I0JS09_PUNGR|nr:hypothetical protein CRG98_020539 [Punica granatum]
MAEENRIGIPEEVNPLGHLRYISHRRLHRVHLLPIPGSCHQSSIDTPPPQSTQAPPPAHDATRVAALERNVTTLQGMVNQMATDMAELMALVKGLTSTSSSSTSPSGIGPTVDLIPWVLPTLVLENIEALASTMYVPAVHPIDIPSPPSAVPAAAPSSLVALSTSGPALFMPPYVSMPAMAPIYTIPPPMIMLAPSAPAPAPPPTSIPVPDLSAPTQAALVAPPTNLLPEMET